MRAAFPASAARRTGERRSLAGKTAPRPSASWPAPPAARSPAWAYPVRLQRAAGHDQRPRPGRPRLPAVLRRGGPDLRERL